MFYTWQMNDGRWHVSAFTSAPQSARMMAHKAPGFETKAEAEQWAREASATWADVAMAAQTLEEIFTHLPECRIEEATAYREEPTAAGIQLCIPGTERRPVENGKPAQLSLWG